MSRTVTAALALGLSMLAAAPAIAQLPDDVPPPRPQGVNPGNLDLGAIQRDAPAFGAEAPRLAPAPQMAPPAGFVPTPSFGYIHQFGSFQVTRTTVDAMFMLSAVLPFPDGRRSVDFYRATLTYDGRYTDPGSGITGYLYSAQVGAPVNDRRFFLFGDRNLNIADPSSNGTRWVIYYNGRGERTYFTTARFYMP